MTRLSKTSALALALLPALLLAASPLFASPIVTLTTQTSSGTVNVGDTFTVTVSAQVSGGAANDGITDYDIDLFPSSKTSLQLLGVASQSTGISLSTGTADTGTGGLLGISAVFDAPGAAVGTTVPLFTVTARALAAGPASVSAGLSVYPNGLGVPFELNVSGDYTPAPAAGTFTVDTSNAIAHVTVLAPEPSSALLLIAPLAWFLVRRRSAPVALPVRARPRAFPLPPPAFRN